MEATCPIHDNSIFGIDDEAGGIRLYCSSSAKEACNIGSLKELVFT